MEKALLLLLFVILPFVVIVRWHDRQDRAAARATVHRPAPRTSASPTGAAVINPNRRDLSDTDQLTLAVAETYNVPAGLLYGIWRKESGGLRSGFGSGRGWYRASELVLRGSRCHEEYSVRDPQRCSRWWEGLQAICSQIRNGRPLCDPNEVRTSYAFAMGPMQLLPTVILDIRPDGTVAWTANAADFDRDGVVDPHSLPDAMAMSARFIRRRYDDRRRDAGGTETETASWQWAANSYYGSQTAGYFEGTTVGRLGIVDYWRQWSEAHPAGTTIASR